MQALHHFELLMVMAHFIESHRSDDRRLTLGEVAREYRIDQQVQSNWIRNMLYTGLPYLERRSILHKDSFVVRPDFEAELRSEVMTAVGASVFDVNALAGVIRTDAPAPSLIPLPRGWRIVDLNDNDRSINSTDEFDNLIIQLRASDEKIFEVPTADESYDRAVEAVSGAVSALKRANQVSDRVRDDVIPDLELGLSLLRKSGTYALGAARFLVLDRLKQAYCDASEEILKDAIRIAFFATALYYLGWLS